MDCCAWGCGRVRVYMFARQVSTCGSQRQSREGGEAFHLRCIIGWRRCVLALAAGALPAVLLPLALHSAYRRRCVLDVPCQWYKPGPGGALGTAVVAALHTISALRMAVETSMPCCDPRTCMSGKMDGTYRASVPNTAFLHQPKLLSEATGSWLCPGVSDAACTGGSPTWRWGSSRRCLRICCCASNPTTARSSLKAACFSWHPCTCDQPYMHAGRGRTATRGC